MLGRYQAYSLLNLWSPGGVNAMVIEYCSYSCRCSARPGTSLTAIRFPVNTGIALARAPTCQEACSRAPMGGRAKYARHDTLGSGVQDTCRSSVAGSSKSEG
jgi:hypothetical protein